MKRKVYLNKNVYDATQERLQYVFSEFEHVLLSFSGGKDSGVLLSLVLDFVKEHGIKRKFHLFYQDFEAMYSLTTSYVHEMFERSAPYAHLHWMCLPIASPFTFNSHEGCWYPWDDEKEDQWVRPMPTDPFIINLKNNYIYTYEYKGDYQKVSKQMGEYIKEEYGSPAVTLLGLRADESLNRMRAFLERKIKYKDNCWIGRDQDGVWVASPIYDWSVSDVWYAVSKFGYPYNKIYDRLNQLGFSPKDMRVASPFNPWGTASLYTYRIIEPDLWDKMLRRVDGANFAALYGNTEAMGYGSVRLPDGHTWKSYALHLLATLPDSQRAAYTEIATRRFGDDALSKEHDAFFWKEFARAIIQRDPSAAEFTKKGMEIKRKKSKEVIQRALNIANGM